MSGANVISSHVNEKATNTAANINVSHRFDTDCKFTTKKSVNKSSNVKENVTIPNGEYQDPHRVFNEAELQEVILIFSSNRKAQNYTNQLSAAQSYKLNQRNWDQIYSFPRLYLTGNSNENRRDPFVLQPSLFHRNNVPPTIYFCTKINDESRPPIGLPKNILHLFKWKISSITPNSIRNCISFMKFETIRPSNTTENSYIGSWCKHMPTTEFSLLEEWRKVNHYPGSFHMGRKDKLSYRLRLASQKHAKFGKFHPATFVLPDDYDDLNKFWKSSPSNLFIMKPPASARGNGVKVINNISQIPESALSVQSKKRSTMIVQQYIANPCLLENGQKFDLRVYVLITSVDPLRIYVYEEGLVRFASSKYTNQEDGIIDQYMHLTNYFINKNNQQYRVNNDCESLNGCKWTLKRFWRYLREHYKDVDTNRLWAEIIDIIIKTIVCCEGPMARLSQQNCKTDYNSYELFGFDIILDENFKPWILEVNITPSLKSESNLDANVKYKVIKDMFNIVGYHLLPPSSEDSTSQGELAGCRIFFDRRLYTQNLTKRDKIKHLKYQDLYKHEYETRKSEFHVNEFDSLSQSSQISVGLDDKSDSDYDRCDDETSVTNKISEQQSDDESNGYVKLLRKNCILNNLSQSDVRVLLLSEDELSRCGQFKRVFPSASSSKYLEFFDKPRYYNLLLDAWEQQYEGDRMAGIKRLSMLAHFLN